MTNKKHLIVEAENLYVYKLKTEDSIAQELQLSRRTIVDWKSKGDWDYKRKLYLKSKMAFHEEIFEFARKIMKDISADMEAGEKIDPSRMYTFCKLVPMFMKIKDYEDITSSKNKKKESKGLTADIIAQIEEEVLGIQRLPEPQESINLNDDKPE